MSVGALRRKQNFSETLTAHWSYSFPENSTLITSHSEGAIASNQMAVTELAEPN